MSKFSKSDAYKKETVHKHRYPHTEFSPQDSPHSQNNAFNKANLQRNWDYTPATSSAMSQDPIPIMTQDPTSSVWFTYELWSRLWIMAETLNYDRG